MRIPNPFQMNDWKIKKFLTVVIAIQLAILGAIGLDALGIGIPILRQLIGFIYLTFVPGSLILRILKIHKFDSVEILCFSAGLSLAMLMLVGLFMNVIYPLIGISKPISLTFLIITLSVIVSILCVISYIRDKDFSEQSLIEIKQPSQVLFLFTVSLLVALGTYLVNFYHNNILLMILLPIVALLPVLTLVCGVFKENTYPLIVFVVSISLLYHTSLISNYIWGWDIHIEYYFSKLVLENGYWDSSRYGPINGMLAIVMLAPIYSLICNLGLVWVFKIIYPLLFSFVPLTLYHIFKKQTNEKVSLLSCCFFMFIPIFFTTMQQLARQQIAELFLVLLLLLLVNERLKKIHKSFMLIIFGFSMIVSHYGTSYLFMFILFAYFLLSILISKIQPTIAKLCLKDVLKTESEHIFNLAFTIFFTVVTLGWYTYTSSSSPFIALINSVNIIFTEFANPWQSDAYQILIRGASSPLHDVTRILYNITQFLIVLGLLDLLFRRKYTKGFNKDYTILSLLFFSIWIISVIIPYYGFDFTRVYHITLLVLSPYCVVGGIVLADILRGLKIGIKDSMSQALKMVSVLLFIFLLFNSGWVYEVAKDNPTSIALSNIDYPRFNEKDVIAAKWLHNFRAKETTIYADDYRWLLLIGFEGYPYTWLGDFEHQANYVFLGSFNVEKGVVLRTHIVGPRISLGEYVDISEVTKNSNKIYTDGAQIYNLR